MNALTNVWLVAGVLLLAVTATNAQNACGLTANGKTFDFTELTSTTPYVSASMLLAVLFVLCLFCVVSFFALARVAGGCRSSRLI